MFSNFGHVFLVKNYFLVGKPRSLALDLVGLPHFLIAF